MAKSLKLLVANGVNLDLLGQRESELYGRFTLKTLEKGLWEQAAQLAPLFGYKEILLEFFQSNDEAAFLESLSKSKAQGLIINPGAWTHTSLALADRLAAVKIPFVEVHISNLAKREPFRHQSYCAPHATGVIYGFGETSYHAALFALLHKLNNPEK